MTGHKQTTDGQEYTTGYTYNLSGALIEQTYPSGRVVKNTLDSDGTLSQVQSKRSAGTFQNYANGFVYNAAGAVTAMRLGNGLWENTTFNSRLQPTQIGLGSGAASQNKLKLEYSYGTTNNNGNVLSQTITVPGVTLPFVQTYTYDSLNRLSQASEKPSGWANCTADPTQCWQQTFTYDRYGNRNFDEANTDFDGFDKLCSGNTVLCVDLKKRLNPSINTANNRLSTSDDYDFDAVGNTTEDPDGRVFVYDAENKQVQVKDSLNQTIGEYFYDGDGKRVKKVVPGGETTVFVYDAAGKLIGEYSTVVQTGNDAKVVYTTNDHLGSPRINTDGLGNVTARHDYHPFGEEITRSGYGSDMIRKQFTGYEWDGETGLDFAQARMYQSRNGRFMTVDPIFMAENRQINPQMINLYAYAVGNPMLYVDPSGEENIRLGKDEEEKLKKEISQIQGLDQDDPSVAAHLAVLQTRLDYLQEGNRVAGAWLDSLRSTGQDDGLQLSDIMISTDPGNDITQSFREMYSEDGVRDFIDSASKGGIEGSVMDGKIWLPINGETYQQASGRGNPQQETYDTSFKYGDVTLGEINAYGGTILKHENVHKTRGDSNEVQAYKAQLKTHQKSRKSYVTPGFFKARESYLKARIREERKR